MKTNQQATFTPIAIELAAHRWGRVLLHLGCFLAHPRHLNLHWHGIIHEIASRSPRRTASRQFASAYSAASLQEQAHELRGSRCNEAHSSLLGEEISQSLLTSAATVRGFDARPRLEDGAFQELSDHGVKEREGRDPNLAVEPLGPLVKQLPTTNLKRTILAALGLAIVTWAEAADPARSTVAAGVADAGQGPRLVFAEEVFDFGKVKAGEVVRHEFVFTNAGDQRLEILQVLPHCGCTTATAPEQPVAPGQSGVIPVVFDSKGINGPTLRSISVLANDPARSNMAIKIMAEVSTPIEILPNIATFHHDPESPKSETKVLRVLNHLKDPVEVAVANWTNRSFQVALETVRPGREFELKITAVPPLGTGTVTMPLLLKTTAPEVPLLKAFVVAIEQPPIVVTPGRLAVPGGPLRESERRAVMIRNLGRVPLSLSDPELNLAGVQSKIYELQRGRLFSVVVTFPAGFEPPTGPPAELRVRSNHPRHPVIRIPLSPANLAHTAQAPVRRSDHAVTTLSPASQ